MRSDIILDVNSQRVSWFYFELLRFMYGLRKGAWPGGETVSQLPQNFRTSFFFIVSIISGCVSIVLPSSLLRSASLRLLVEERRGFGAGDHRIGSSEQSQLRPHGDEMKRHCKRCMCTSASARRPCKKCSFHSALHLHTSHVGRQHLIFRIIKLFLI